MLGRQPTCSRCPLPRKSKIKSRSRSFEVCRHTGSNYTCNMAEMSEQGCEEKTSEEVITVSPAQRQRRSDQNQSTRKLTALKQVFSASVNCFRCTTKPAEGGDHNEGEYHPITIFNRHTRDSVDLNAVCGASAAGINQCSNAEHKSPVEEREAIKSKAFKPYNPLIVVQSKAKSARPKYSLQPKGFWRQKAKKSFFKERTGETKEYITGEIIVLVNEHADETMAPSTYPENEVKCYPETLTVTVDVSDITSEIKDKNAQSEAPKTHSHNVGNVVDVMAGREANVSREIQMIPQSLEDSCGAQNNMESLDSLHKGENTNTLHVTSERTASEHPEVRDEIRLCATFNSDSFSIHHNAAAENSIGPVGNKIPGGTLTDDGSVMENLHLDVSGGSFHVRLVHSEQQCEERELLLLQTACSVVQAAVKTALKQFKDELQDSAVHMDLCY
ncbi:uncharacterized protein LOC108892568 [Lates calcarifer]|uniref:Uncharacterized protein LOC108892568 n=1 Tax=Lates calcarifer TaxID=8187 RepID=A0AAJ7Q3G1_LATCA|nr:uncharacterized protein LOC108892568 [Lates calcarifer]